MIERVSVVVPVYNAKNYLTECIESVLAQDYPDIELILVDDGSHDGSVSICEKYTKRYEHVLFYSQKNRGPAVARNNGMRYASGEYLFFVDADDYLAQENVVSRLVERMRTSGADIVVGDYMRFWEGRMLPADGNRAFSTLMPQGGSFRFQGFFSVGTLSYLWGKCYRTSFLKENDIWLRDFLYGEDKLFNMTCYVKGAVYDFVDDIVYVYRKNDASISYAFRSDTITGWLGIANEIQAVIDTEKKEEYEDLTAYTIFFAVFFDGKMYYQHERRKLRAVREVLRQYGKSHLARRYFAEMAAGKRVRDIPSLMWRTMIRGFAIGMHLHMYAGIALGIKMLVDFRIDESLSDTGKRGS